MKIYGICNLKMYRASELTFENFPQRKEAELRESSAWAQEKGKEAADLRIELRKLREKILEQKMIVRDSQQQMKQLHMWSETSAPPRVAAMISDFREGLKKFRDGLSSWKEDVRRVLVNADEDFARLGRELEGFVCMVMPLPHVEAPLVLDTR